MLAVLATASAAHAGAPLDRASDHEKWPLWGHDAGGARHSGASQLRAENVDQLAVAWRYDTGDRGQGTADPRHTFETTPVLWERRLYLTTAWGALHVIDATTGKQVWVFDPEVDRRNRGYGEVASRGVSLWHAAGDADGHCDHRVLWGSIAGEAYAVDARSGELCADFGAGGKLDLKPGAGGSSGRYTVTSPPVIHGNSAIFGSAIGDNNAIEVGRGIVRAIDVRSGAEIWRFDPIPRDPSNPAYASWDPETVQRYGGANAWPPLSLDAELGIVFVPTGSPSPDFFGGTRQGDNHYANSLVALDAATGAVRWHQQLVHHDVWDYDLPAQPVLTTIERDGERVPVVMQATKTGHIHTFERATGKPFWPVEEVAVPQSGVSEERLSPTQPIPTRPPALTRGNRLTPDDAWGLLFFDTRDCRKQIEELHYEGLFTPPSTQGTLFWPAWTGGLNWGGLSVDGKRQIAVAFVMDLPGILRLIPKDKPLREVAQAGPDGEYAPMRDTPYYMYRNVLLSPLGVPCTAPPWGSLVGVDLEAGSIAWRVPLGGPAELAPVPMPNFQWGMAGIGGPVTTSTGLVFVGAAGDHYIRAFDTNTGDKLWEHELPFGGQSNPMSYAIDGRQYVVIAAGGHSGIGLEKGDAVVAFALP